MTMRNPFARPVHTMLSETRTLPDQIHATDKRELRYWARHYGVSEHQLLDALEAVGASRHRVEGWLKYLRLLVA